MLSCALICASLFGGDDIDFVPTAVSRALTVAGHKRRSAQEQLELAKSGKINPKQRQGIDRSGNRYAYRTKQDLAETVKGIERQIAQLRADEATSTPAIFTLPYGQPAKGAAGMAEYVVRIVQVVDASSAIVRIGKEPAILLDETTGWYDGLEIHPYKKPIVFIGTRQYSTASGSSRTLPLARPWTVDEIERFREMYVKVRDAGAKIK